MINIENFFNIIKKYELKEENGHLLLPENSIHLDKTSKITRSLFEALGDNRVSNNFRLYKKVNCINSLCVSPQCYEFRVCIKSKTSNLCKEDVIEIANDMNLDRLLEIGDKEYFKEYNEFLPEILKLSPEDYKIVIAYLKGKQ